MSAGDRGKMILGGLILALGVIILIGLDRTVEAAVLDILPDRVTEWSTMF